MSSVLGTLTVVDKVSAPGPVHFLRCTLIGDAAYPSGGTTGLLNAVRTALGDDGAVIMAVHDIGSGDVAGGATVGVRAEYIQPVFHDSAGSVTTDPRALANGGSIASGDKLFMRLFTTGAESGDSDMSDATFNLLIIAK